MQCPADRISWQHVILAMSFERHDAFWIKSYFGKVFHVLSPGEGLVTIAALLMGTWCAVSWLKGKRRERML